MNDPQLVREFLARHGRLIYKSISYIRSIVHTVEANDLERLENIRWCPVQFQEYVAGTNVRVHVLDRQFFATAIHTSATDYRYAYLAGEYEELEPFDLSVDTADPLLAAHRALGLHLLGYNLQAGARWPVFCLEVNPCPAFSYYETSRGSRLDGRWRASWRVSNAAPCASEAMLAGWPGGCGNGGRIERWCQAGGYGNVGIVDHMPFRRAGFPSLALGLFKASSSGKESVRRGSPESALCRRQGGRIMRWTPVHGACRRAALRGRSCSRSCERRRLSRRGGGVYSWPTRRIGWRK